MSSIDDQPLSCCSSLSSFSRPRTGGWLLKHIGQPAVVGEMAAGLVLGPVCLGSLFPVLHAELFSKASLVGLSALSTVGLVLFMFVVGLELKANDGIRAQIKASSYVGALSVIVPLVLGLAISPALYPSLAPAGLPTSALLIP